MTDSKRTTTLRLAIQKSGRLSDSSMDLLAACGIKVSRPDRKLRAVAEHFDMELLFLRDDDIPGYVEDGVADLGIVGENVLFEKPREVEVFEKLGFGKCRLSIAVPTATDYDGPQDLDGRDLATSYPGLLGAWLDKHGVSATIHEISGSVEIAPGIGLADGICDLVSSGSTLISNGLKEVEVIMRSEAVLFGNKNLTEEQLALIAALRFRIKSVQTARKYRYILMNVPNASIERVTAILPGMKSPTIMPLAEEGWSSVHSVITDDQFWDIIEQLKAAGAEGMLVTPIEKMVM